MRRRTDPYATGGICDGLGVKRRENKHMLNDNAKKWVEALRSGENKQINGRLYDGVGHCCLGVGCKIVGLEPVFDGVNYWFAKKAFELPGKVKKALGLNTAAGGYGVTSLISDNDSGKTFTEIADIIESEPEGLFA